MGGADTNPNPVQFCSRLRILKIRHEFDAVKVLLSDSKTSVELSTIDDEKVEEPFLATEIGISYIPCILLIF